MGGDKGRTPEGGGTIDEAGGEKRGRSHTDPAAGSAGTGGTVGAGGGTGSSGAGETKKQEKEPVLLAIDERKKEKEKREAQKDTQIKEQPKPKRKKKEPDPVIGSSEISSLIVSVFSIIASRPGMEHWAISDKEAKTVADPLSQILAENNVLEKTGVNGSYILLVMAAAGIILPRLFITLQVKEPKRKEVLDVDKTRKADPNGGSGNGSDASHGTAGSSTVFNTIPTTA